MSVKKYLTLNGLAYFLNKIKSTMADELDGKANDSEVVHKAQTETVTGEKTFKKDVKIIDLNANERPGVKFEVNGSFRTFEQAKDSLPDPDFGDFGGGYLWDGGFLADNTKIQNSMGDYVINDITFGTANYSSVIEFNNYYKVTYEDGHNSPEDVKGMLRFELAPYENVEKDHEYWSDPDLYLYAMLDGGFSGGSTILGNPRAPWTKAYIGEINCEDIKFGFGMASIFDVFQNIRNLSYVFRYSSTALTPSSTNANSLLDNTDNLKVGDKVIDSSGVLFSITAIDTANSTFTIGTALIDLAQDSDVVHKSGNETVGGTKTFDSNTYVYNSDNTATTPNLYLKSSKIEISSQGNTSGDQNLTYLDKNNTDYAYVKGAIQSNGSAVKIRSVAKDSSDNSVINELQILAYTNGNKAVFPSYSNEIDLGLSNYKWKSVYATNYYYGSNNVEFSTKFVTTDTTQTVGGSKTFSDVISSDGSYLGNESSSNERTNLCLRANRDTAGRSGAYIGRFRQNRAQGEMSGGEVSFITFDFLENSVRYTRCFTMGLTDWDSNGVPQTYYLTSPSSKGSLGTSSQKWKLINGLNPSALSMPDLSNGIDISSYITVVANANKESLYTPPANGWVCVRLSRTSGALGVLLIQGNMASSGKNIEVESGVTTADAMLPVVGGVQVSINSALADGVVSAYFYPCQGNV